MEPTSDLKRIEYRADIDGLRAIAVLMVVAFHASPKSVPGGFIGVDIFFVISGFLISGIIFRSLDEGVFSYLVFYTRRIRRLFPALLIVMVTTGLFGWYVLFPGELNQLGKHVMGGIGFVSNLILWSEIGYFDAASESKPLLHLWSLGIEEQFYIFWPILVVLIWKSKLNLLSVIVFVGIASFVANAYTLYEFSSESSFYLPFNRFWELMLGSMLAYFGAHKKHVFSQTTVALNLRAILGVLFVFLAAYFLDENSVRITGWALLPAVGALLLISAPNSWINRHILSKRVVVYIGLISYPLYLWHWPILSFLEITQYTGSRERNLGLLISVFLAILTYELVEKKLRSIDSPGVLYTLLTSAVVVASIGAGTYSGFLPARNNSNGIAILVDAVDDWTHPHGLERVVIGTMDAYKVGVASETVLYWGDSHIQQYSPRVVKLIFEDPKNTKSAVFITDGGCPPISHVYEEASSSCTEEHRQKIKEFALSSKVDSIVIGAYWKGYFERPAGDVRPDLDRYYYFDGNQKHYLDEDGVALALQSLEFMISELSKHKKVFVILDNPEGSQFDPLYTISGSRISGYVETALEVNRYARNDSEALLADKIRELAVRANAIVIDAGQYLCPENQCLKLTDDGSPIYKDSSHLRASYVKEYATYIDETIQIKN